MVCGKPSIRDALKEDVKDISGQTWQDIQLTAENAIKDIKLKISKLDTDVKDIEKQIKAKEGESTPTEVKDKELDELIGKAFGGQDNFKDPAEATATDCGFSWDIPPDDQMRLSAAFMVATEKFANLVKGELKDQFKAVKKTTFLAACNKIIVGDFCSQMCDEFGFSASEHSATGGKSLGSPTHNELVQMRKEKNEEMKQKGNTLKECELSLQKINRLAKQFTENDQKVTEATREVGDTNRKLRMNQMALRHTIMLWKKRVEEDKAARAALAEAVEKQEEARVAKEEAANTLRMWEEHMAALLKAIEHQKTVVQQTEQALRAAEAASRVVVEFKNKLSTALVALVDYYEESITQPLRVMGIDEDVAIESLFPTPSETDAAKNLRAGLAKTDDFCKTRLATLQAPAVAGIEASGVKLVALCNSQDWNAVASEVDAAVNARKQRAIKNLEQVQQKVVSYTGVTANKDDGEVEGVWKAVAIFGETNFAKNYLVGWKMDGTSKAKGTNAGFMIELAKALEAAREKAQKLFEEAKKQLKILNEEKKQVEETLEIARMYLQMMIEEWEKAVKITEEKEVLAKKAKRALDIVTARKVQLEAEVSKLTKKQEDLQADMDKANAKLKETHDEALGFFMETLHASEQQGAESWD